MFNFLPQKHKRCIFGGFLILFFGFILPMLRCILRGCGYRFRL
ncbi:MAG: hypothetical protein LBH59_01420 [Planctomycetaceae bacterium]|nr:hypothetical protein [Planctomycetaceae bacterium]